ncbi:1,4-alpha-glucan branching enzyme [Mumia flava]|uniref:1,4-alpha-glucan branching enzyme GlgB n=1 Tax=Mumia flava TaxID=1348852 RepID=A0A2M9B8B4_9ACTN|nr:1,4-alpha-glucan branching protein GlgB [Mumia flava]PJJ54171.1 1,4-alpha-glucan branching enzyme [Mumia flava]
MTRDLWRDLGAHASPDGVDFAVWAPNARRVQVVGDHSGWSGDGVDAARGDDGVWRLHVPGIGDGALYKYAVEGADGVWREKADPFAAWAEVPPSTASRVFTSAYDWTDQAWMRRRAQAQPWAEPMSTYEVHLGSWLEGRSYRDLATELVDYVARQGFTHVELMPVMEHPFGGSWGYQVTGYYAPTSRYGSPDDFRALVDAFHAEGIGVILDWVPAHFPRDEWALARFDGTPLYEHPDPRRGEHPDWGTYTFDLTKGEVREFLLANAFYWLEEFHIDGLRVDAVASMLYLDYSRGPGGWVPNIHGGNIDLEAVSFFQELNRACYGRFPGISMIAEESTAFDGVTRGAEHDGLGFGFKWNLGWMHDTLGYVAVDPVFRSHDHHRLTFAMMYHHAENFILPLSHDEVVHGKGSLLGKMPGEGDDRLAHLRTLLGYQWSHPGKQLLFMGGEIAQDREWSQERSLDWHLLDHPGHAGMQRLVADLNAAYTQNPALWADDHDPSGFAWIEADDTDSNVLTFARRGGGRTVVVAVNMSGVTWDAYRLGVPAAGTWQCVLSTDQAEYGGWGATQRGDTVTTDDEPLHGQPCSAVLRLPALSVTWWEIAGA